MFQGKGTLEAFGHGQPDSAYRLKLGKLDAWLPWPEKTNSRKHALVRDTRLMLLEDQHLRPSADDILDRLSLCDQSRIESEVSIFGDCCRVAHKTRQQQRETIASLQEKIHDLQSASEEREIHASAVQNDLQKALIKIDSLRVMVDDDKVSHRLPET